MTQPRRPAPDPLVRFRRWCADAARVGAPLPEAMALATTRAGGAGAASVRIVLLKQADAHGFLFFTDTSSRKGEELRARPRAAVAFYWNATGRQVRIEGRVERVTPAEADAYWATRPRASRLAALASRQSATLRSRAALVARWRALARRHRGRDIPRPPTWTGFRFVPEAIEFWTRRAHRLHERELFSVAARRVESPAAPALSDSPTPAGERAGHLHLCGTGACTHNAFSLTDTVPGVQKEPCYRGEGGGWIWSAIAPVPGERFLAQACDGCQVPGCRHRPSERERRPKSLRQ